MSKKDNLFSAEQIQQELDKLEWLELGTFKKENPNKIDWNKEPPYYLYRSTTRPTGYAGDDSFLFAAPFVRLGMESRFDKTIKNFPIKAGAIVKIFEGSKENKFYPDESIHFVEAGMQKDTGVAVTEIKEFDERIHEDTNAINNKLTDDIYILNNDVSPAKIAKTTIKSKLFEMMKRNEMKDSIKKINFSKEALLEQEKENKDFTIQMKSIFNKELASSKEAKEALKRIRNRKIDQKLRELGVEQGAQFGGVKADIIAKNLIEKNRNR